MKVKFWLCCLASEIWQSKKDRWGVRVWVLDLYFHLWPASASLHLPNPSGRRVDKQETSNRFLVY